MNICLVYLSDKNMDDEQLNELLNNTPPRSIILIEDIDAAFIQRENGMKSKKLSFSGLLNALGFFFL